jgi:hypothetical protein
MNYVRLASLSALFFACKKEPEPTAKPAPAPPPSATVSAKKLVKVAPPPITAPSDKELTFAGKKTKAIVCKLDDSAPMMVDKDWWHHSLTSMAVARDGSIYVVDHQEKLRHYINQSDRDCELALDPEFGDKGIWDFKSPRGSIINFVTVDAKGNVYFNWHKKPQRIVGNKAEDVCSDTIRSDAWSPLVIADGNVNHGEGCSGKYAKGLLNGFDPGVPDYDRPRVIGFFGEELISDGVDREKGKSIHKIGVHDLDGKRRLVLGGHDDEMLWSPKEATHCDGDLCLVDAPLSRTSVFRWTREGKFLGKLALSDADLSMNAGDIGWSRAGLYIGGAVREKSDWVGVIVLLPGV